MTKEDITALAAPVLRHRVLVNYRAEAEGVSVGKVIERVLAEREITSHGRDRLPRPSSIPRRS